MAVSETPDPKKPFRWGRVLLFFSLALNLLIVGIVAGAFLRHGMDPQQGRMPPGARGDLGLGPYGVALEGSERRQLRRDIGQRAAGTRNSREASRAEMAAVLDALRREPFDRQILSDTMGDQQSRLLSAQNIGKTVLLDHLAALNPADRQAYADRLQKALGRLMR